MAKQASAAGGPSSRVREGVDQDSWVEPILALNISYLVKHTDDTSVLLVKALPLISLLPGNGLNTEYLPLPVEHPSVEASKSLVKCEYGR